MDDFYDVNHSGLEITDPAEQLNIRKSGTLQGFFLAQHLLEFFPKKDISSPRPTDCIGIRVYNAGGIDQAERRLIAVGVTKDGSELSRSNNRAYLASSTAQLPVENMRKDGATHTVWQAKAARTKKADKERITFASYFSRKMIDILLSPKAGQSVDGIGFYIVPRDLKNTKGGNTHLGVSCRLVKGKVRPMESAPGDLPNYIVSDQSCPDYCIAPALTLQPTASAKDSTNPDSTYVKAAQPIISNERYLNVWD